MNFLSRCLSLLALGALVTFLAGCSVKEPKGDVANGEKLFVANCGGCHTLAAAKTKGNVGPDLDDAFRESREEGFGSGIIKGVVEKQIAYPSTEGEMPAKLIEGDDAHDVAVYVSKVAGTKPAEGTIK